MAQNDSDIARAWVKGETIKRSWLQRVRGDGPWGGGGEHSHGLRSRTGTVRFGPNENSKALVSYGHWLVAVRLDSGTIVLNADNGPTATTRAQQADARDACKDVAHCLLPFSALRAASIRPEDVVLVATTEDRVEKVPAVHTDGTSYERTVHFLGETLFTYGGRHYVCGLDRNDNPSKRHFFLARLPVTRRPPKTVDAALDLLRPKGIPPEALRQGEWFLVPSDKRPKPAEIVKAFADARTGERLTEFVNTPKGGRDVPVYRGLPVLTDKPDEFAEVIATGRGAWGRRRRHVASRVYLNGAVYVSGMLRDAEHGPLKLGDGKQWFRVVRNAADGSWGATGDVD